jgi:hypothetical protein
MFLQFRQYPQMTALVFADPPFRNLVDRYGTQIVDRLRGENGQTLGQLCQEMGMSRLAVTK